MQDNLSSAEYVKAHGLVRKYGFGLAFIVLAAIGTSLMGDPPSLVTFKTLMAIPFVIAAIGLGAIFHPERSRTPFSMSFIERTLLEGLLISIAVIGFSWAPDHSPWRSIVTLLVCVATYFGVTTLIVLKRRR